MRATPTCGPSSLDLSTLPGVEIHQIPIHTDNYCYLIRDTGSNTVAVIDPGQAEPVLEEAKKLRWTITDIFITHHHWDHVDGLEEVKAMTGALVTGPAAEHHKIDHMDRLVYGGETIPFGNKTIRILDVPGHTLGQIGYLLEPDETSPEGSCSVLVPGDSLFAMGCGRIFEGDPVMMWNSLKQFARGNNEISGNTLVCAHHEYTASNAAFALSVDPENEALQDRSRAINALRESSEPTVPYVLEEDWDTNPFLRPDDIRIRTALQLEEADDQDVFTALRKAKDNF
ncbi:hydroxyacylglutathione hydrolase [Kiloniella sp. b19]|uniref:hydroxyacylglutathione hydrolase n=1 Tax=Kiloniella sp. GXU_MW_B19 TaxID=3141326 RepID=UPI0031DFC82E